jgi:hypothetical protein
VNHHGIKEIKHHLVLTFYRGERKVVVQGFRTAGWTEATIGFLSVFFTDLPDSRAGFRNLAVSSCVML